MYLLAKDGQLETEMSKPKEINEGDK